MERWHDEQVANRETIRESASICRERRPFFPREDPLCRAMDSSAKKRGRSGGAKLYRAGTLIVLLLLSTAAQARTRRRRPHLRFPLRPRTDVLSGPIPAAGKMAAAGPRPKLPRHSPVIAWYNVPQLTGETPRPKGQTLPYSLSLGGGSVSIEPPPPAGRSMAAGPRCHKRE